MESCAEYNTSIGLISVALSPSLSSSITSLSATGDGIVADDLVTSLAVSDDAAANAISSDTISLMPDHATTNSINENGDRCITFQVNMAQDALDENPAGSIDAAPPVTDFDVGDKSFTSDETCDLEIKSTEAAINAHDVASEAGADKCDLNSPQLKQLCYQFVYNPDSKAFCLAEYDLGKNPPMLVVSNGVVAAPENENSADSLNETSQVKPTENENAKFEKETEAETLVRLESTQRFEESLRQKFQGDFLYVCQTPGCGQSFATLGYMKYHQTVHSGGLSGQKSLQCNFEGCNRKFTWPAHLKYHQLTHTGERLYECEHEGCGQRFYTAQRLSVHLRTHTGERPFICTINECNKSFTTAGNLKNHSRTHTGEKPFKCTFDGCKKQFAEQSSLRKHKLTHSKEKPFSCSICGRVFSQSGSRNVHMKRHIKHSETMTTCLPDTMAEVTQVSQALPLSTATTSNLISTPVSANHTFMDLDNPNSVVVLRQDDDVRFQDFQGSESVVFSNAVFDHVVTVTTQPADGDTSHLDLLASEEELGQQVVIGHGGSGASSSANVLVLSQPEEMVSMAQAFHDDDHSRVGEEIVYDNDLLKIDTDSQGISAHDFQQDDLTASETDSSILKSDGHIMDSLLDTADIGPT